MEVVRKTLSCMCECVPVNLEFQELAYAVPQGRAGSKIILRNISGQFKSGHLNAILGPSGAGKSTLLNVLAAYKTIGATGTITVNGEPRNIKKFRKLSRYIMQDDLLQPRITVEEYMMVAADLKLNKELRKEDKLKAIGEILDMLRLTAAKDTRTERLSGGERKRLSIALELLNNPPVLFLDEPTTGLDDMSSSQCISFLKLIAEGGRTVICSIHAPSARMFAQFDHTYIVSGGQCVFQGYGEYIIPFMSSIGLSCPTTYNPADFVIEVSSGEYGMELLDKVVTAMENGRNTAYCKKAIEENSTTVMYKPDSTTSTITYAPTTTTEKPFSPYNYDCSIWYQFKVLIRRFWLQTFRDINYVLLKTVLYIILGLLLGCFYLNMGTDASKALFNFGFCYTTVIAFLYLPLMPVLLDFPTQIRLIKREHFNKWYGLTAYYLAMSMTTLPLHIFLNSFYISICYVMSGQPIEFERVFYFFIVCNLVTFVSDSMGLMISSVLSIVNGMFLGPVLSVPLMLLAVYGIGDVSPDGIPIVIRFVMYLSYLRYGMEGIVMAIYGNDRPIFECPDDEEICPFRDPKRLLHFMGMENVIFWVDLAALVGFFLLFRFISFYLLRQRLRPNKTFAALQVVGRIIKSHLNISH